VRGYRPRAQEDSVRPRRVIGRFWGGPSTSPLADMKRALVSRATPYAALLLRVTLGLMFLSHFYWKFKVLPGGFHSWWSSFHANGYPGFVPWYAISA
jgi:hypothetical protein